MRSNPQEPQAWPLSANERRVTAKTGHITLIHSDRSFSDNAPSLNSFHTHHFDKYIIYIIINNFISDYTAIFSHSHGCLKMSSDFIQMFNIVITFTFPGF